MVGLLGKLSGDRDTIADIRNRKRNTHYNATFIEILLLL